MVYSWSIASRDFKNLHEFDVETFETTLCLQIHLNSNVNVSIAKLKAPFFKNVQASQKLFLHMELINAIIITKPFSIAINDRSQAHATCKQI